MNPNDIVNFFLSLSAWSVVKVFVLLAVLIYVVFAFILLRQVSTMTKALYGQLDFFLKGLSILLLILSVGVFVIGLFYL